MKTVNLSRARLTTSRLGLGTSRLHYIDRRDRLRLLELAAEIGFTHFDTAPSYGDGLAETELGNFMHGRRDRFVLATKFGFEADPLIEATPKFAYALRGARSVMRRAGFWQPRLVPFTGPRLRQSVERSLQRLRTDWIDIVFLHEPGVDRLSSPYEILDEFTRLRERGLIRAYGLAGNWIQIRGVIEAVPQLAQIVQTAETEWPPESPPDIAYGAIACGPQSYWSSLRSTSEALQRLRSALKRRPQGVVLVSTTKTENLQILADTQEAVDHDF